MIGRVICWMAVVVVSAILLRALFKGEIEFGTGPSGLTANRSDDPAGYWTIVLIELSIIGYLLWLLIR